MKPLFKLWRESEELSACFAVALAKTRQIRSEMSEITAKLRTTNQPLTNGRN